MNDMVYHKCMGCGYCCVTAQCAVSVRTHGTRPGKVCPELLWENGRHYCRLMRLPGKMGEAYRKELAANTGCCSSLNSWRKIPFEDRTQSARDKLQTSLVNPLDPIFKTFLRALGRQWISSDLLALTLHAFVHDLKEQGITDADTVSNIANQVLQEFRAKHITNFMG